MKHLGKIGPVAAVAAALVIGGGSATASSLITTHQIKNGAVTSAKIANGAVHLRDLNQSVRDRIAPSASPSAAASAAPLAKPGVTAKAQSFPATTITDIGGSWSSRHTTAGTFTLQPGTYLVSASADFYQVSDTPASPVLQLALRGTGVALTAYTAPFPSTASGTNVGLGSDGTPNGIEQTTSAYDVVTVTKATDVSVDLFGYNVDRGSEGSGEFGAITKVSIAQLG